MSNPLIKAVVTTLIQVVLIFDHHNVQAEFSDTCDNSTSSLSCIHTYEQLYHNLTKSDNSFNIESALYPSKKPSSVRVFVNLHGPNKTGSPIARYTWSLSCLYVAIPYVFLEIVSLGSILVRHRTKELNLTIPHFCCNVSKTEDERKKTINDMIENVLAALQDLASSPGIRNPELNNAECVIEDHGLDMQATGRYVEIRIIIWGSFLFTLTAYLPLCEAIKGYAAILEWFGNPEYKAILCVSVSVGVLGSSIWLILLSFVIYFIVRDGPLCYLDILFIIMIPVLYFITPLSKTGRNLWDNCTSPNPVPRSTKLKWFYKLLLPVSAAYTCFCLYWMLIGIMLDPIWGLTATLAVCFVLASFTYVVFACASLSQSYLRKMWVLCLLAVIFLTLGIIFAGQSFNGRETADVVFKTVLLTALTFLTSWLSWKRLKSPLNMQVAEPNPEPEEGNEPNPEPEEWNEPQPDSRGSSLYNLSQERSNSLQNNYKFKTYV